MWRTLAFGLASFAISSQVKAAPSGSPECAQLRQNILDMENRSVRPPGWVMFDTQLRMMYVQQCIVAPTRKPADQYWYHADGTPLGTRADYSPPGWDPTEPYRPDGGAYTTTPEIAAACARSTNPSLCAMAKEIEADCRTPVDTQQRSQCAGILNGQVPDLPPASEPLPPVADLVGPARAAAPRMSDAQIWADRGFQRMCAAARDNEKTCAQRRQNMQSIGSGQLGGSGQAGAFYECQQLYGSVLNMCASTQAVATAPAKTMPAAPPKPAPPQQAKPADGSGHSAPPPAQPQQPQMSAQCQQLVSTYVGAAQANDGARALAGYNALKSAGGCGVLDKVDSGPPPAAAVGGDPRFPTRRATPLTDSYVQPCNANEAGCAQAMRQLEQAASPEAKSALVMHAISTGLQLGAAVANGLAAGMPQPGVAVRGGGTNMNSIGNRPVRGTYGQGAPTGPVQRTAPSDITGTK